MEKERVEMETGIVLNIWKGSALALDSATEALKKSDPVPEPPMVFSQEKGRDEENPNDPAYRRAVMNWNARLIVRYFQLLIATASEIVFVPETMIKHDSDEFLEVLEVGGIPPQKTSIGLYVQWVSMYVTGADQRTLGTQLLALAGVSEASVAESEATFLGDEERDTDQDVPDNVNGRDRDHVPVETSGPRI